MGISKVAVIAAASAVLAFTFQPSRASAGALDGLAGGAIGFALGAMMAAPRAGYAAAPRTRRVVVYRNRPSRATYAAAPARRRTAPAGGAAVINASSDPFAASASPRPIPVSGR